MGPESLGTRPKIKAQDNSATGLNVYLPVTLFLQLNILFDVTRGKEGGKEGKERR